MENKSYLIFLFNDKSVYEIEIDNETLKLIYQCNKDIATKESFRFKGIFKSENMNKLFEIQNKMSEFNDSILNGSNKVIESISFGSFKLYERSEFSILNIISSISNRSILQSQDEKPLNYPVLNLEIMGGN